MLSNEEVEKYVLLINHFLFEKLLDLMKFNNRPSDISRLVVLSSLVLGNPLE